MKAAKESSSKHKGYDVAGVGTLRCRHSICLNLVDFYG
jgi:hypothetical protein